MQVPLAGFHITFLNSDHNHHRLLRNADLAAWAARRHGFRFRSISDGLPPDYPRVANNLMPLFDSLKANTKPILRDMLVSDRKLGSEYPVTCIIVDGIMSFVIDITEEVWLPVLSFRTISACSTWCYFCIPKLVEGGELPFGGTILYICFIFFFSLSINGPDHLFPLIQIFFPFFLGLTLFRMKVLYMIIENLVFFINQMMEDGFRPVKLCHELLILRVDPRKS